MKSTKLFFLIFILSIKSFTQTNGFTPFLLKESENNPKMVAHYFSNKSILIQKSDTFEFALLDSLGKIKKFPSNMYIRSNTTWDLNTNKNDGTSDFILCSINDKENILHYGALEKTTGNYYEAKYDAIDEKSSHTGYLIAAIKKNNLLQYGLINNQNKINIPFEYNKIFKTKDNTYIAQSFENSLIFYDDKFNQISKIENVQKTDGSNLNRKYWVFETKTGKGFFNNYGKIIRQPQLYKVEIVSENENHFAYIKNDAKSKYYIYNINTNKTELKNLEFYEILSTNPKVLFSELNGKRLITNLYGKKITELDATNVIVNSQFSEKFIFFKNKNNLFGIVDVKGIKIQTPKWISMTSENSINSLKKENNCYCYKLENKTETKYLDIKGKLNNKNPCISVYGVNPPVQN